MTARQRVRIARARRVVVADRPDGAVLIDVEHGRRYALDTLGSQIWNLLVDEPTLPALIDRLWTEYDAPVMTLAYDVAVLIAGWDRDGLIEWR